jgi:hypothetical protein
MAEAASRNQGKVTFLEKIGDRDIELDDFKVDDLRKIASECGVSGSHDMHKQELVEAINKARKAPKH